MKSNTTRITMPKGMWNKRLITCLVLLCAFAVPVFAASGGSDSIVELDAWADKILELFQSNWVKALLLVALIIEALGLVLSGQQGGGGQMIKKFAPWIIGTIILLSASSICSYFLESLSFEVSKAPQNSSTSVEMTYPASSGFTEVV